MGGGRKRTGKSRGDQAEEVSRGEKEEREEGRGREEERIPLLKRRGTFNVEGTEKGLPREWEYSHGEVGLTEG
jgi:hypothetical protein